MADSEQIPDERYRTGVSWVRQAEYGWGIGFGSVTSITALCNFLMEPESDAIKWGYTKEAAQVIVNGILAEIRNDEKEVNGLRNQLYLLRRQGRLRSS